MLSLVVLVVCRHAASVRGDKQQIDHGFSFGCDVGDVAPGLVVVLMVSIY